MSEKTNCRLQYLHKVLDELMERNTDKDGNIIQNREMLESIISIYRDIQVLDEGLNKKELDCMKDIIHYAVIVNGGAAISQTGPDEYQVDFIGNRRAENNRKNILRINLEIGCGSIRFRDYTLL